MIAEALWEELERQQPGTQGLVRRRVRDDSSRNLFVGVHHPDLVRTLIIAVSEAAAAQVLEPPVTRALRTDLALGDHGLVEIRVSLLAPEMARVFSPFVDDVVEAVADAASDAEAISNFMTRFSHWKRLLAGADSEGLGAQAAQGLYGELWTLRHLVLEPLGEAVALLAWHGPDRLDRDFAVGDLAAEVKTTVRDNPLAVAIAGERQLDLAAFSRMFLVALAIDALPAGGGQTLNDIVDELLQRLTPDSARMQFRDKLLEYGYVAAHRPRYDATHYSLRELAIFEVLPGFPRITEADVPSGVGDVRYLVSLPACEPWRRSAEALQRALLEARP